MDLGPRFRRWCAIGLLVFAVGVLPTLHVVWRLRPTHQLDLLVFDVTVPDSRYIEHAALDRVLTNERVPFELGVDHVGASPGGAPHGRWPEEAPDMIVLADGYGVYVDDDGVIGDLASERVSPSLEPLQAVDVSRWIEAGVPAYGEFAIAPEPTPERASEQIQEAFGFDATGWIGVAVEDLAELSPRLRALGPSPWLYEGPGIALVTTVSGEAAPETHLVVLGVEELDELTPVFIGGPSGTRGNRAPFTRWFELIEPVNAEVEAWIELPVNDAGMALLDEAGLPARWPGVVTTDNTIYVAGDGLEDQSGFSFRHFAGGDWLSWHFDDRPEERFFHQILRPALSVTVDRAKARQS